jgi:hypothetical protein
MRSSIVMAYESRASGCGRRVRAPGESSRPAVAATSVAWSCDQGAGARVWGLPATSSALPPGRATRTGTAPRPGGEGRLYGQGPSERTGPGAPAGACRRVQPERSREPRLDRVPAAAGPGGAWSHPGAVKGDRQGRVWRRGPRDLRLSPPRCPRLAGAGHAQPPGHAGGSPRLPRQDGHTVPGAGPRFTPAAGSRGGDVCGHRGDASSGRLRASSRRGAAPGLPAAVGRGGAAAPRRARARSTGR